MQYHRALYLFSIGLCSWRECAKSAGWGRMILRPRREFVEGLLDTWQRQDILQQALGEEIQSSSGGGCWRSASLV